MRLLRETIQIDVLIVESFKARDGQIADDQQRLYLQRALPFADLHDGCRKFELGNIAGLRGLLLCFLI